MARPFQRSSIEELEQIFSTHSDNAKTLEMLSNELRHRTTNRAYRLLGQVEEKAAKLIAPSNAPPSQQLRVDTPRTESGPLETVPPRQVKEHPPISNDPDAILSTWTALEVLSPVPFSRPERLATGQNTVASLDHRVLPWERGEGGLPQRRLYYQIVLGTIKMDKAIALLVDRFGDTRPDFPSSKGNAILAVVIVDKDGRLVEPGAISVSSFGWGVPAALKGTLTDLARWPSIESELVRRVEKELLRFGDGDTDEAKRKTPLTRKALNSAHEMLVRECDLPADIVEPPSFAIRSYEYFRNPNPPEPLLLNSFFLADLSQARSSFKNQKAPDSLKRYLGTLSPNSRKDLLREHTALEAAIAPRNTSVGKWPGRGRHSLALLQQAAVTLAFSETTKGGLIGINGPPGTGKTTLLRDILAGVLTERAEAMLRFADPEACFTRTSYYIKSGDARHYLHRLDRSLQGFEMVVASSNNKAVENVSREIPAETSIAEDLGGLRYLKVLSDKIHERETWGLAAAVLGNALNRGKFRKTFWWDDDVSINSYLLAVAAGDPQVQRENAATGTAEFVAPQIVTEEKPPQNHEEALKRWKVATQKFKGALEKSRKWQSWLESVRQHMLSLDGLIEAEKSAEVACHISAAQVEAAEVQLTETRERLTVAQEQLRTAETAKATHERRRPGFWARLWGTLKARQWKSANRALTQSQNEARSLVAHESQSLSQAEEALRAATATNEQAQFTLRTAIANREAVEKQLEAARKEHGVTLPDANFFNREHSDRHQASPWYSAEAQRAREDVFVEAVHLHRAFIDAAAKPIRNNLGVLMNVLSGNSLGSADKDALIPGLWSTLFLIVPLVSTTFASVGKMFAKLPPKSLGWLLIDEAGQALPQAAVGAIMRSKRVVVVGDPAQIEPVVTLPDVLTEAIARSFGVEPDVYSAPIASVQTLADAASNFATDFETRNGTRTVGVPLLVHRRCAEPMFSISNKIAYSGMMVQAKAAKKSAIREALGESRWIHVEGGGEDKWCAAEGVEALKMLHALAEKGIEPNLYIVTPFVIVAERLRELIRSDSVLRSWYSEEDAWKWVVERVGTVHTVQGREAEVVVLVLGAPNPAQTGARGWAGGRPNLLNVAVTRAQEVLYVIGNRRLWRNAGHFADLDNHLE